MPYPDNFSSTRFNEFWEPRYRARPRFLTKTELADIETLRQAKAIMEVAIAGLRDMKLLGTAVDHSPTDALLQLEWDAAMLGRSIGEIEGNPQREADAADNEHGIFR